MITKVDASTAPVILLPDTDYRGKFFIYNNSTGKMYVALGDDVSSDNFTFPLFPGSFWEGDRYYGPVSAVWTDGASGNAMITEINFGNK
jgi:hypothetical protein